MEDRQHGRALAVQFPQSRLDVASFYSTRPRVCHSLFGFPAAHVAVGTQLAGQEGVAIQSVIGCFGLFRNSPEDTPHDQQRQEQQRGTYDKGSARKLEDSLFRGEIGEEAGRKEQWCDDIGQAHQRG